jgi:hypothetical protein
MAQPVNLERLRDSKLLADTVQAGSIEAVLIDDLNLDHGYQRDLSADLVQKMAAEWDMAVAGTITVSRRPSGQLYIIDGQHRAAAAKLAGETHILAQVLDQKGRADEAGMRLKGNVRRGDKALERFRAQLAAGDKSSKAIVEICRNFGTKINQSPDTRHGINAISAVEFIYSIDKGVLLTRTFEVIQKAWGPVEGMNTTTNSMRGIAWMLHRQGMDVDVARLADRLSAEGPEAIERKARSHKAAMGGSLWLNWYRAAIEVYNHRLPEGSRLEWVTGGWSLSGPHGYGD